MRLGAQILASLMLKPQSSNSTENLGTIPIVEVTGKYKNVLQGNREMLQGTGGASQRGCFAQVG